MQSLYEKLTEAAGRSLTAQANAVVTVRTSASGARLLRISASDRITAALLVEELQNTGPPHQRRYSRKAGGWVVTPDGALDQWLRTIRSRRYVAIAWESGDWDDDEPQRPITPSRPLPADAFRTLHLLDSAPPEVIKAAYKALALKHHPDAGGSQEHMTALNLAYEVLSRSF